MASISFRAVTKRYGDVHRGGQSRPRHSRQGIRRAARPLGVRQVHDADMIAGLEEITEGELAFDGQSSPRCRRTGVTSRWCSRAMRSIRHKSVYETSPLACAWQVGQNEIDRACAMRRTSSRSRICCSAGRASCQAGSAQRVALGRAMVRQPAVFLMDEPLSNLDAALRISMRAEIKHLHNAMQTTFVYVTHDQAEALTLADRIVVMNDGVSSRSAPPTISTSARATCSSPRSRQSPINYCGTIENEKWRDDVPARGAAHRLPMPIASGRDVVLGNPAGGRLAATRTPGRAGAHRHRRVRPAGRSDRFLGLKVEGRDVFVRVDKQRSTGRRAGDARLGAGAIAPVRPGDRTEPARGLA